MGKICMQTNISGSPSGWEWTRALGRGIFQEVTKSQRLTGSTGGYETGMVQLPHNGKYRKMVDAGEEFVSSNR